MKFKPWIFTSLGIMLYIIMSMVDRLFVKIPDFIYMPAAFLVLLFLIVGIILDRCKKMR